VATGSVAEKWSAGGRTEVPGDDIIGCPIPSVPEGTQVPFQMITCVVSDLVDSIGAHRNRVPLDDDMKEFHHG
jgi:hypothetical protein